jgi:hypothetical protein
MAGAQWLFENCCRIFAFSKSGISSRLHTVRACSPILAADVIKIEPVAGDPVRLAPAYAFAIKVVGAVL